MAQAHPEAVMRDRGAMGEEGLALDEGSGPHRAQQERIQRPFPPTPALTPCGGRPARPALAQREQWTVDKAVVCAYTPTPRVHERTTTHDACASSDCACHDRGWGAH